MKPIWAVSTASDICEPELVERFRKALEQLNPEGGLIGLAVSGGPDSMAMLLLAHAAIPGAFEVATVDHGLRPEAKDECGLVAKACEQRGLHCEVLNVDVGAGNVQAQAREARYGALGNWANRRSISAIATAHHADDQAETFLMRLNRGSGVAGLAGVRASNKLSGFEAAIIRPLLGFRRDELGRVVSALAVASDPSNHDPRFDRVRMRGQLAQCDWLNVPAIAQSSANLAEAYEALQAYAQLLWSQSVRQDGQSYILAPVAAREMNRRLLAMIMERLGGRPRGGDVSSLLARLEQGHGGNLAGILATVETDEWVLRPEPPRKTG